MDSGMEPAGAKGLEEAKQAQAAGRHEDALAILQAAVDAAPEAPEAWHLAGISLRALGREDDAAGAFREAIGRDPGFAPAHLELARLLAANHYAGAAGRCAEAAAAAAPSHYATLAGAGEILFRIGQHERAHALLQHAVRTAPDRWEAVFNLGCIHQAAGRNAEARDCYARALANAPGLPALENNLGMLERAESDLQKALTHFDQALELAPDFTDARLNRADVLAALHRFPEALEEYRRILRNEPREWRAWSGLLIDLHYREILSPREVFEEHRRFGAEAAQSAGPVRTAHTDPDAERRLRIGYVSPDFRAHSVSWYMLPLLERHDRERMEVFLYSNADAGDEVTARLQALADHWRQISARSNSEADALIREDRIDILVDLAGHTRGNRLPLFARKPAPLQVTWLGYPDTTGMDTLDLRITDAIADPPGESDALCSERLVRLEGGFHCWAPPDGCPDIAPKSFEQTGETVFGSFNNFDKASPETLRLWGRILAATPGSRLLAKASALASPAVRTILYETMAAAGASPDQIEIIAYAPTPAAHMGLYNRMDIALDTHPYNGTTTTFEALWMGVPVITLRGRTHAGRVGASILGTLGLGELVARSPDEYVEKALALAEENSRRDALRASLRDRLHTSPFMDAKGFARKLESAYRYAWTRYCAERTNS